MHTLFEAYMIHENCARRRQLRCEEAHTPDLPKVHRPTDWCSGHLSQVDPEVVPPLSKKEMLVASILEPLLPFLVQTVVYPAGDSDLLRQGIENIKTQEAVRFPVPRKMDKGDA